MENYIEQRPWGQFEILSQFKVHEGDVCVKILTVKPGKRLSYQSHKSRAEHWTFVEGQGTVILDDEPHTVLPGSSIQIPLGSKHRVANTSDSQDLIIVEVSTGHFDEEDIERFSDDYGRV